MNHRHPRACSPLCAHFQPFVSPGGSKFARCTWTPAEPMPWWVHGWRKNIVDPSHPGQSGQRLFGGNGPMNAVECPTFLPKQVAAE